MNSLKNKIFYPFWDCQTMTKMQRHQQEALWELISTELIYINKLKIIKDVRRHHVEKGFSTFFFFWFVF